MEVVNDIHSRLNCTPVRSIERPRDIDQLVSAVQRARDARESIAICGGRHAMGGQQFATDAMLIDLSAMNRPIVLDSRRGLLEIEAGATWPDVIRATCELQTTSRKPWAIQCREVVRRWWS